jgi:putative flippase GtrA
MTHLSRRKLIAQFLEYMVGGGVYFWSGYGVFAIGYSVFHWDWILAKMLADLVGWSLNFVIQRYWAFNNPVLAKKPIQVTGRYIVITLCNFLIDYSLVASLKHVGVSPYAGLFISSGFFTAWNYVWYRFWVFRVKSSEEGGA